MINTNKDSWFFYVCIITNISSMATNHLLEQDPICQPLNIHSKRFNGLISYITELLSRFKHLKILFFSITIFLLKWERIRGLSCICYVPENIVSTPTPEKFNLGWKQWLLPILDLGAKRHLAPFKSLVENMFYA